MNIPSFNRKEMRVFSWVGHSSSQPEDTYRTIKDYAKLAEDDPLRVHYQRLLRYGLAFLLLLILAPFLMLGLIIGITMLL